jgi:hypothetical protein
MRRGKLEQPLSQQQQQQQQRQEQQQQHPKVLSPPKRVIGAVSPKGVLEGGVAGSNIDTILERAGGAIMSISTAFGTTSPGSGAKGLISSQPLKGAEGGGGGEIGRAHV